MRDLDTLRTALREEADGLPVTPLLPGVRSGAQGLQRRRLAGLSAAVVVVLAVVSGVGYLVLNQSSRTLPAGAKPDLTVGDLVGPTWYLTSWTTAAGAVVRPTTDRPPTLVFDSQTAAHSDDPTNTTSWSIRLRKGTLFGVEGPTTAVGETAGDQAANEAVTAVLAGEATWQILGSELVIRSGSGRSVTYSKTAPAGESAQSVAALEDKVWYLLSWTTAGVTGVPATDQTPTLAFHDAGHAVTVIPNWVDWAVTTGNGSLHFTRGDVTATPMSTATRAVYRALTAVLPGSTSWQVTGRHLVIRQPAGSLTFTSDLAAEPQGSVEVRLLAEQLSGNPLQGKEAIAGTVRLTRADGRGYDESSVEAAGSSLQTEVGVYRVSATIKNGSCTSGTVVVRSDRVVKLTISCRDGLSKD